MPGLLNEIYDHIYLSIPGTGTFYCGVRVCVIPCILDVRLVDVPAGVTQEGGHTGFLIHLPSTVFALIFVARRVQLSLFPRRPRTVIESICVTQQKMYLVSDTCTSELQLIIFSVALNSFEAVICLYTVVKIPAEMSTLAESFQTAMFKATKCLTNFDFT